MKLCTFEHDGHSQAAIIRDAALLPIAEINGNAGTAIPEELLPLIEADCLDELREASAGVDATIPLGEVRLRLPYARPGKIWCIGLNYRSHAEDIDAVQPEEPGSFMKPASALFEPGGTIELPPLELSKDVDAEGELARISHRGVGGRPPFVAQT